VSQGAKAKENKMPRNESDNLSLVLLDKPPSQTLPHVTQILSISATREDHQVLCRMLHNVRIAAVGTRQAAMSFLCLDRVPVIVCERDLPDGTWKDILGDTAAFPNPPVLVVTSSFADEYLWAEVLNLGGYDLLAKPFSDPEVKRVLAAALRQNTTQTQKTLVAGAAGFP
jgi:DNA-binding response OmpR family regulator